MSQKCIVCGANPLEDSQFCFWHSDTVSQAEKDAARSKGGKNSRKVPLNLDVSRFLPIETPADLSRFYNELLKLCAEEYREDLSSFIRAAVKITPKLSELLAFQELSLLQDRLAQLESKRNGKLLSGRIDDNANFIEYKSED